MTESVELPSNTRSGLSDAWGLGPRATFEPLGNGLINHTLLVRDAGRERVLQRLNTQVFRDPGMVMRNCRAVTAHLGRERDAGRYASGVLELVPTLAGAPAVVLADGSWWRMYKHVPDTVTHDTAADPALAREAGRGFGAFTVALAGLDPASVGEVIPHFHDPVARFDAFQAARANDRAGHAGDARVECNAALGFTALLDDWSRLLQAGLPWRITHNDCKLNNLLFDRNGHTACVADLDTVMPGTLLFDFGDLARTLVSPVAEDSNAVAAIRVRSEYFAALARGYSEGCGTLLEPFERSNLVLGARLMTWMLGLRFLTDYLDGTGYFRVTHPTLNLERARNQFALCAALSEHAEALQALVPGSR